MTLLYAANRFKTSGKLLIYPIYRAECYAIEAASYLKEFATLTALRLRASTPALPLRFAVGTLRSGGRCQGKHSALRSARLEKVILHREHRCTSSRGDADLVVDMLDVTIYRFF